LTKVFSALFVAANAFNPGVTSGISIDVIQ